MEHGDPASDESYSKLQSLAAITNMVVRKETAWCMNPCCTLNSKESSLPMYTNTIFQVESSSTLLCFDQQQLLSNLHVINLNVI